MGLYTLQLAKITLKSIKYGNYQYSTNINRNSIAAPTIGHALESGVMLVYSICIQFIYVYWFMWYIKFYYFILRGYSELKQRSDDPPPPALPMAPMQDTFKQLQPAVSSKVAGTSRTKVMKTKIRWRACIPWKQHDQSFDFLPMVVNIILFITACAVFDCHPRKGSDEPGCQC